MSDFIKNYKEDFVLLLEAGFVAIMHQDEDSATKLFQAAQLVDPQNVMPKIGLGYMHFLKLELQPAIIYIKQALAKEPNNEFAQALLGVCMTFSTDMGKQGVEMLHKTQTKSHDPEIRNLANNATDFYEKFIKAPPSPAEISAHKRK
ncbi:MAG: SctF chaperone SctG [Chlamydiae bacterium]|nr:SctF chaperone SctG [Chlamydiota bacterium]